ncbi:MAG: hypothetical protein PHS86_14640, partial [Syntrophaceae bacterium]|nr:hypothetical protein [Syntrophaceae bacterium]
LMHIPTGTPHEDLLVPIFKGGRLIYDVPASSAARQRCLDQLERLHPAIRRLLNPHEYPAGIEMRLHDLRTDLIRAAREAAGK